MNEVRKDAFDEKKWREALSRSVLNEGGVRTQRGAGREREVNMVMGRAG